jgi:hypothetical protein
VAGGLGASVERTPSGAYFSIIRSGHSYSDITGPLKDALYAVYRDPRELNNAPFEMFIARKKRKSYTRSRDIKYLVVVDILKWNSDPTPSVHQRKEQMRSPQVCANTPLCRSINTSSVKLIPTY